jgi:hypothetical protein
MVESARYNRASMVQASSDFFRGEKIDVDEETEQKYLQNLLQRELHHNNSVTIILPPLAKDRRRRIVLRSNQTPSQVPEIADISARLKSLLDWDKQLLQH